MALFGKRKVSVETAAMSGAFWRSVPIRSNDPAVLHQYGIGCVSRGGERDGRGMMAAGWALWPLTGLTLHQAGDFMRDGYDAWEPQASPGEKRLYLGDIFERLRIIRPVIGPTDDVWSIPRHIAVPAADSYTFRAWTCSELLELGQTPGIVDVDMREDLFQALAATHPEFLPARSASHLRILEEDRNL